VNWTWDAPLDPSAPLDRAGIIAAAALRPGDPFGIPELHRAKVNAEVALQGQGYPDAVIRERVVVDREKRTATVEFTVEPGERFVVTGYRLIGLRRVREDLVRREVGEIHATYSPKLLRQVESDVHGTQAFASVSVTEDRRTEDGRMTLAVVVRERQMQDIGVGLELDADQVQWSQVVSVRYRHANLFRNLTRLQLYGKVGYAELPAPYNVRAHGPRAELSLMLTKKGWLERKLVWSVEPKFTVDIRQGYQLWTFENRMAVYRFFGEIFSLALSYNNHYLNLFNYEDLAVQLARYEVPLGDSSIASFLELETSLFKLDNFAQPHRGIRLSALTRFANKYLGSQYDYVHVEPKLMGYFDPHPRVHLAGRVGVGFILPYNTTTSPLIDQRFYLGGASDVRGWSRRRLSPRVTVCDADTGSDCQEIPVGGETQVLANLEMRIRVSKSFWLALFGDIGDVRLDPTSIVPSGWMYSVGAGVRYATAIGAIRFDLGVRLNESDRFPEPYPVAFHLSFGEIF